MFCNKCGAQVADTAVFCNKCGASVKSSNQVVQNSYTQSTYQIQGSSKPKIPLALVVIVLAIVVIIGVIFFRKPSIYGTWTDAGNKVSFTFAEDGSLHVAGKDNILGAELFQFTDDEEGNITLQAQGGFGNLVSLNMQYELSKDMLELTVLGQKYSLYRTDANNVIEEIKENPEEAEKIVKDAVEDALDVFQPALLYGTWTDSSGIISFTFNEDGTVYVGGLADTLGASLFTFTEVDNDTFRLKAQSDNKLISMISLNLNYEISKDVMTVEIAGQTYQLIKQ